MSFKTPREFIDAVGEAVEPLGVTVTGFSFNGKPKNGGQEITVRFRSGRAGGDKPPAPARRKGKV